MNKARACTTTLAIGFLVAGCGSGGSTTTQPQGGSGGGASASGGAAGNPSGGATSSGGSTSATGGASASGGNQTGGATVQAGGTGGRTGATGGASGTGGTQTGGGTGTGGATAPGTGGSTTPATALVTSSSGAYWKTDGTWTEVTSGTADITVNDTTTYQTWDGFGGTFNEMGWDALSVLAATDRDRAIKLLFDTQNGAAFVYGRVPIGASDYAMDRYSLDETANDYTMTSFSIDRDRQKLIPYIKAALAIKPDLHLWASPWTPPTWMKTGAYTTDGMSGWDGGNMKDDAQVLQAHALYLAKFVQEYGKEDITIEAIHPQNEPGYATRYPSCLWTAALMNKFIGTYLGPTFASQNVTAKIYLGTMSNNDAGMDGTIVSTVTGDSTSMKYVKGFGLQWNMLPVVSGLTSKNLQIVQSEHKCGNYPWNPGGGLPAFDANKPQNDYPYGVESWGYIRDWIKAGVNVYSAWNMVLDNIGKNLDTTRPWPQNALLTVDRTAKTLTATPAYYVFRHVSQYVVPGAKRVATTGSSPDALAFKNPDGSIVVAMYNSGSSAKTTTLSVGGTKLQFSIPANGFATVKK
jgi:glucosylceramidase